MPRDIPTTNFWISYTRLSYEDIGLGGAGITDQHRTNIASILDSGEPVVHLSDSGGHRSGRSDKQRPDWRLAVNLLTANPYCKGIIATFQDRLSRDVGDTAALVKLCERFKRDLVLPSEGIDTRRTGWSPEVKMMIHLKASFAQMYAEDVGRKIKARVDQIGEALIPWGKPPFGHVRVGRGIKARIEGNADAPAVPVALQHYAGGMSFESCVIQLNSDGVMFRDRAGIACPWRRESIRTVVGNVLTYAGFYMPVAGWDAKATRIVLEGDGSHLQRYAAALKAQRSPNITPIIEDGLASMVIERRFLNQASGRKNATWTPLLTPILHFKDKKMRAASLPYGRFYRTKSTGIYVDAEKLDAKIIDYMSDIHIPPEMREKIHNMLMQRVDGAKLQVLQERGEAIHRKQQVLVSLLIDDRINRDDYNRQYDMLDKEKAHIRAEMNKPTEVEGALNMLCELSSLLRLMKPVARKNNILRVVESVHMDDRGEIERIELRPWAKAAFGEVALAYGRTSFAEGGSRGRSLSTPSEGLWWLLTMAGLANQEAKAKSEPLQNELSLELANSEKN